MPSFDSAWDVITNLSDLTVTRWNDVTSDLKTWLGGGLDSSFFALASLDADIVDGEAATLDDPAVAGPQVFTRETRFTGKTSLENELHPVTEENWPDVPSVDTTPAVNAVRTLFVKNNSGASQTITRFVGGQEGQVLRVVLNGASETRIANGPGTAAGEIKTRTGVDLVCNPATQSFDVLVANFIYTDLNGTLTNKIWLQDSYEVTFP